MRTRSRRPLRRFLYPAISRREWPVLLSAAFQGAAVAGLYGILHDQATYSISPDYFTRFKFAQFAWADLGWPPRLHVAEIGFLATWWVGAAAGWFLARLAVRRVPLSEVGRRVRRGFLPIFGLALAAALAGFVVGYFRLHGAALEAWADRAPSAVDDLRAFVRVGYIHNGGYLGALAGFGWAVARLRGAGILPVPAERGPHK